MTMTRAAADRAFLPAGGGTIVNVTVSPHHGMPAMAHTGAARAAVERSRESSPPSGPTATSRWWQPQSAASTPSRCASTPSRSTRGARRSVPLQRLGTDGGVRLARRAARHARRPRAQRFDGHARRRRRQLDRPVAAAGPDGRQWWRADGGAQGSSVHNVLGAADGSRTRDLKLGRLPLYQLSYRRTYEAAPLCGAASMTVCTNNIALGDFIKDDSPWPADESLRDVERLVLQVIELQDERIRLATVAAWVRREEN